MNKSKIRNNRRWPEVADSIGKTSKLAAPGTFTLLRISYYEMKISWKDKLERMRNTLSTNPFRKHVETKKDPNPNEVVNTKNLTYRKSVSVSSNLTNQTLNRRGRRRRPWLPSDADDEESDLEPGEYRSKSQHDFHHIRRKIELAEKRYARKRSSRTKKHSPGAEKIGAELKNTIGSGDIKVEISTNTTTIPASDDKCAKSCEIVHTKNLKQEYGAKRKKFSDLKKAFRRKKRASTSTQTPPENETPEDNDENKLPEEEAVKPPGSGDTDTPVPKVPVVRAPMIMPLRQVNNGLTGKKSDVTLWEHLVNLTNRKRSPNSKNMPPKIFRFGITDTREGRPKKTFKKNTLMEFSGGNEAEPHRTVVTEHFYPYDGRSNYPGKNAPADIPRMYDFHPQIRNDPLLGINRVPQVPTTSFAQVTPNKLSRSGSDATSSESAEPQTNDKLRLPLTIPSSSYSIYESSLFPVKTKLEGNSLSGGRFLDAADTTTPSSNIQGEDYTPKTQFTLQFSNLLRPSNLQNFQFTY